MNSNKRSSQRKIRSKSCLRFGNNSTDDCHTNEEQIEGEINGDIEYEFDLIMDNNEITEIVLSAKRETSGEHDSQHYDEECDEEYDEEDHNDNSEDQTKHLKCKYKNSLKHHSSARLYTCDWPKCGKQYKFGHQLKRHKSVHSGLKPFKCEVKGCGQRFANRSRLCQHKLVHAVKRFACDECHKKFARESYLIDHRKRHFGDKEFKCEYRGCDKCFVNKQELKLHTRHIHTKERSYECDFVKCGKMFVRGCDLKRHKLIHYRK